MSLVEASPSGKFEMKIATRKAIFIIPTDARVIPSAAILRYIVHDGSNE